MFSERNFVGPDDPANEDSRKGVECHEGRVDGPFALDNAGIKDHKSRYTLQADEGGRCQLPGVVAGVEPWWIGRHDFWSIERGLRALRVVEEGVESCQRK